MATTVAFHGSSGSGGGCEPADAMIDAAGRLQAAVAILAPRAKRVTELVVLAEMSLAPVALTVGINRKATLELLRDSLDHLAAYYGLTAMGPKRGSIAAWHHPFNADV